ncbi:MAG: YczE/YyaS/YitT family protein [Bacillota bacterium]|jgi:uncharacterized membrane protein YczE
MRVQKILMATGGLAVLAMGITISIAVQGPDPWGLFVLALKGHLPLSLGVTSQLGGIMLIALNYFWGRRRPGLATVMSMVLVGLFIDLYNWLLPLEAISRPTLRIFLLGLGIISLALGISIYVRAELGEGPVEGMMFVLSDKLKVKVGVAKVLQDLIFLGLAMVLGVLPQWGTVATALCVGPLAQFFMQGAGKKKKAPLAP